MQRYQLRLSEAIHSHTMSSCSPFYNLVTYATLATSLPIRSRVSALFRMSFQSPLLGVGTLEHRAKTPSPVVTACLKFNQTLLLNSHRCMLWRGRESLLSVPTPCRRSLGPLLPLLLLNWRLWLLLNLLLRVIRLGLLCWLLLLLCLLL